MRLCRHEAISNVGGNCRLVSNHNMPGVHHKKIGPPIKKVKYVEVHTKKGNYFKEVTIAGSPAKVIRTPSVALQDNSPAEQPPYYEPLVYAKATSKV